MLKLSIDRRAGFWAVALLLVVCGWPRPAGAQGGPRDWRVCTECHRNIDVERERALGHADSVTCMSCHHIGMSNDPKKVAAARMKVCQDCHTKVTPTHTRGKQGQPECSACHDIHTDAPLAKTPLPNARCQSCHESPHVLHAAAGEKVACSSCHKLHDSQRDRVSDASVQQQCVSCHKDEHPAHAGVPQDQVSCTGCHTLTADARLSAIPEGKALTAQCLTCHKGMVQTHTTVTENQPQCADCHSFTDDARLPAAELAISQRCASCHDGEMKGYKAGGHARGLTGQPNPDLPNCVTCHAAHDPERAGVPTRLSATEGCVTCHSNDELARKYKLPTYVGGSYTEDFHGATVQFALRDSTGVAAANVMICSDCHGAHAVAWKTDANLAAVCLGCHEEGGVKLAGAWLGHSAPGPRNQFLVWAARMFYYVLIPFVLGGLIILIAFQMIDQRRKGATVRNVLRKRFGKHAHAEPTIMRFSVRERVEHALSAITFILLCVTGLPQTRPDLEIAHKIIALFGGLATTRLIHRIVGFMFVALFIMHIVRAILNAMRKRRMPVMVPSVQDFRDTYATIKHFLWKTPRPKTGKFDFSEKFEYWGMVMGGTLMCVTGVGLVFPELISQYVPGVFIALFRTLHGLEATFAVMVVVLWHSYGVILRPEVFPLDTSIFTGKISVERLEEEHGLEYDRMVKEGEIAEHTTVGVLGHEEESEEHEFIGS